MQLQCIGYEHFQQENYEEGLLHIYNIPRVTNSNYFLAFQADSSQI